MPGTDGKSMTASEAAAREAVRNLPEPSARNAFRDRLREDFVARRVTPPSHRARPAGGPLRWIWGVTVPAAAALLILLAVSLNRGTGWRVLNPPSGARLLVGGRAVPLEDGRAVTHALRDGGRLELRDSVLVNLTSPGRLTVQLLPGTEMTLPAPPGRWFRRAVRATINAGEMRITTDRGFHGARLFVDTPEVEVEVTGTTLAVIRPDFGSCVCVFDGTVRVAPRGGAAETVSSGHRFTYFKDGNRIDRGDMLPQERIKLGMLQSVCSPAHHAMSPEHSH